MKQSRIAELLVKHGFKIRSSTTGVILDEEPTTKKIAEALDKAERTNPYVEIMKKLPDDYPPTWVIPLSCCQKCGIDLDRATNFVCPDMQCPHRAQLLCEGGDAGVSSVSGQPGIGERT